MARFQVLLFSLAIFGAAPLHADDAETFRAQGPKGVESAIRAGVSDTVLDQVCRQHDCRASRLFWYTDLGEALKASKAEGKPVLSLRLLGKLDEELSCANSRFFRTLLYSDPAIASILRERFILHWQSERPAPRITIDFGDGRKMVQTITGNSIHYLLDSDGKVLDALPGLYSPQDFQRAIGGMLSLFNKLNSLSDPQQRELVLLDYHGVQARELARHWPGGAAPEVASYSRSSGRVPARDAAMLARTKAVVEVRPIQQIQPETDRSKEGAELRKLRELMDNPMWADRARATAPGVRLSKEAEALVRSKLVYDPATGLTRSAEETSRTLEALKLALAIDGLRNDFVYRRALHAWLSEPGVNRGLEALNRRVYESLFLTPGTDPWLGLKPDGVYTGIKGDGISVAGH
jgi:hypothetical protein